jgi:TonB family protein
MSQGGERSMIEEDITAVPVARFDGSTARVMVIVLVAIALLSSAFAACVLLIASNGYRWLRTPFPTTIPRDLPVVAKPALPVGRYADWFNTDDYPESAARKGQEGAVKVALLVGADGSVDACEILAGSGTRSLDRGTCRAAVRHGYFTPARDAKGGAIPSRIELPRVHWVLPPDER